MKSLRELLAPTAPLPEASEASASRDGKVMALWGTGSSGVSATAVNLAAIAASDKQVLLVDLDLSDPSLVVHLGINQFPAGLVAAARLAFQSRLDYLSLAELTIEIEAKHPWKLLPGITAPGRFRDLSQESVASLLVELKSLFDLVVIDLGSKNIENSFIAEIQNQVILDADWVAGVFIAEPEAIAKLMWRDPQTALIANRYRPGVLGVNGKKKLVQTLAELTDMKLVAIIPESDDLDLAINAAKPLPEVVRKGEYLEVLGQILEISGEGK